MKYLSLLIFGFALISISGCEEEKGPANLQLVFKGLFDGNTLVLNEDNTYVNGIPMRMSHLQFYIANIELKGDFGTIVKDIDVVDFSQNHMNAATAAQGETMTFEDVPPGTYTGLKFGIGVPPALNSMQPAEFAVGHPLSNTADHWTAWNSFIFAKVEGRSDEDDDGIFSGSILYHTGGDDLYREYENNSGFILVEGETTTVTLTLDALELFYTATDTLDIINNGVSHTTPSDQVSVDISTFVMDNFIRAINVE
ncbi:MAG: MbnP family protein [Bacteroidota bacterium]